MNNWSEEFDKQIHDLKRYTSYAEDFSGVANSRAWYFWKNKKSKEDLDAVIINTEQVIQNIEKALPHIVTYDGMCESTLHDMTGNLHNLLANTSALTDGKSLKIRLEASLILAKEIVKEAEKWKEEANKETEEKE